MVVRIQMILPHGKLVFWDAIIGNLYLARGVIHLKRLGMSVYFPYFRSYN